jgi:hypothetical protein
MGGRVMTDVENQAGSRGASDKGAKEHPGGDTQETSGTSDATAAAPIEELHPIGEPHFDSTFPTFVETVSPIPIHRATPRRTFSYTLGAAIAIFGAGWGILYILTSEGEDRYLGFFIIITSLAVALVTYSSLKLYFGLKAPDPALEQRFASGQDEGIDERQANRLLLRQYHELTRRQARTSYRNSQIAMSIGFLLLVVGAATVLRAVTPSAQIVVGGLAGLGSALSAYIGSTFIRAYNRALAQMNYYFGQPLVQSYLLEAERMASSLHQERRDDVMEKIIAETLSGASTAALALSPQSQDQRPKPKAESGQS